MVRGMFYDKIWRSSTYQGKAELVNTFLNVYNNLLNIRQPACEFQIRFDYPLSGI